MSKIRKITIAILALILVAASTASRSHNWNTISVESGLLLALLIATYAGNTFTIFIGALAIISLLIINLPNLHEPGLLIKQELVFEILILILACLLLVLLNRQFNIRKEKTYYNNIFQYGLEGILIVDSEGHIAEANPAACNIFHYKREELLGIRASNLFSAEYRRQIPFLFPEEREPLTDIGQGKVHEVQAIRSDHSQFPLEIKYNFLPGSESRLLLLLVEDISIRKRTEQTLHKSYKKLQALHAEKQKMNEMLELKVRERTLQLQKAMLQLEESLANEKEAGSLKSKFAAMASHEFRTPLSTIMFSASLLDSYFLPEHKTKRDLHIRKIKTAVRHLESLLNDFLTLGMINENSIKTHFKLLNLREQTESVIDELKDQLKEGQFINMNFPDYLEVFSDQALVNSILTNILGNAIKYSPEYSVITVKAEEKENITEIYIQDKGIGIPQADQEHIFKAFFRAGNAKAAKGTGLGLFIVKKYTELINANIQFKSIENEGTSVCLQFPKPA